MWYGPCFWANHVNKYKIRVVLCRLYIETASTQAFSKQWNAVSIYHYYAHLHTSLLFQPGRVVTLTPDPNGIVWGVAYKIPENHVELVKSQLDYREKGGYSTVMAEFHPRAEDIHPFPLMLYIGTPDNPNYAGPAEDKEIADIIKVSVGPSGKNIDYLFNLAQFVRENIPEDNDTHLFTLESLVRQSWLRLATLTKNKL